MYSHSLSHHANCSCCGVEFLELFEAFVSMEDRVNRHQRPILVENNAASEKPWPVKDDAIVVQEIK